MTELDKSIRRLEDMCLELDTQERLGKMIMGIGTTVQLTREIIKAIKLCRKLG